MFIGKRLFVCSFVAGLSLLFFPTKGYSKYTIPDMEDVLHQQGVAERAHISYGDQINVLIWNLQKFLSDETYGHLGELSQNTHFQILQESLTNERVNRLLSSIEGKQFSTAVSFIRDNGDGTGVVTGSVYASEVEFRRSTVRENVVKTPKMIVFNFVNISGSDQKLLVGNIHGINFVSTKKFKVHMKQFFEVVERHSGPVLLGGDFNTWNGKRKKILKAHAEENGLIWSDLEGDRRTFKLDHLLTRNFVVKKAQLLNDVTSSDHLPIYAELQLVE